jgi:hypothetical protein
MCITRKRGRKCVDKTFEETIAENLIWAKVIKDRFKTLSGSQASVAHTCNPSYSGDRGQEDSGSKPA